MDFGVVVAAILFLCAVVSAVCQVIQTLDSPGGTATVIKKFAQSTLGRIALVSLAICVVVLLIVISRSSGSQNATQTPGVQPSAAPTSPASTAQMTTVPPKPTSAPTPVAHLLRPIYLDTQTQLGGDDIGRGVVSIDGRTYPHGLQFSVGWADDTREASYAIPGRARTFSAVIGNDDDHTNSLWQGITLLYEVYVDGRKVAVGHARGVTHDPPLHVNVTGGSTLQLQVINEYDSFGGTDADWGNPMFR